MLRRTFLGLIAAGLAGLGLRPKQDYPQLVVDRECIWCFQAYQAPLDARYVEDFYYCSPKCEQRWTRWYRNSYVNPDEARAYFHDRLSLPNNR